MTIQLFLSQLTLEKKELECNQTIICTNIWYFNSVKRELEHEIIDDTCLNKYKDSYFIVHNWKKKIAFSSALNLKLTVQTQVPLLPHFKY